MLSDEENQQDKTTTEEPLWGQSGSFWSLYEKLASDFEGQLFRGWKKDMDTLLIFAGLFSACVTSFLVQAIQACSPVLGPDFKTHELLVLIVQQLDNQTLNISQSLQHISHLPDFAPVPPTCQIAITLWGVSLLFSLCCALGAVLAKLWLSNHDLALLSSKTETIRGQMRFSLFEGIQQSHMNDFLVFLSSFMHISLAFFFAGYIVSVDFLALIVVAYPALAYVIFTVAPFIHGSTPLSTPITLLLQHTIFKKTQIMAGYHSAISSFLPVTQKLHETFVRDKYRLTLHAFLWTLYIPKDEADIKNLIEAFPSMWMNLQSSQKVIVAKSVFLQLILQSIPAYDDNLTDGQILQVQNCCYALTLMFTVLNDFSSGNRHILAEDPDWYLPVLVNLRKNKHPAIAVHISCICTLAISTLCQDPCLNEIMTSLGLTILVVKDALQSIESLDIREANSDSERVIHSASHLACLQAATNEITKFCKKQRKCPPELKKLAQLGLTAPSPNFGEVTCAILWSKSMQELDHLVRVGTQQLDIVNQTLADEAHPLSISNGQSKSRVEHLSELQLEEAMSLLEGLESLLSGLQVYNLRAFSRQLRERKHFTSAEECHIVQIKDTLEQTSLQRLSQTMETLLIQLLTEEVNALALLRNQNPGQNTMVPELLLEMVVILGMPALSSTSSHAAALEPISQYQKFCPTSSTAFKAVQYVSGTIEEWTIHTDRQNTQEKKVVWRPTVIQNLFHKVLWLAIFSAAVFVPVYVSIATV